MSSYKSPTEVINNLVDKHNILVDIEGKFHKTFPKDNFVYVMVLILIVVLVYLLIKIPHIPITIVGNTLYSNVIINSIGNIPYILCKTNVVNCYSDSSVPLFFEGINYNPFNDEESHQIIPLTEQEIISIQKHTNLHNIDVIHTSVLLSLNHNNGKYYMDINSLVSNNNKNIVNEPIIYMKKISDYGYFVKTKTKSWTTKIILSDRVSPVRSGDIITSIVERKEPADIITSIVERKESDDKITSKEKEKELEIENIIVDGKKISKMSLYKILDDNVVDKISDYESILYSLKEPRTFNENRMYFIHPFCLPQCWDTLLMIVVITKAIVTQYFPKK
jgi:hypothetical protein